MSLRTARTGQPVLHIETLSEKVGQVTDWRPLFYLSIVVFSQAHGALGPSGLQIPPACKSQGLVLGSQDNISCRNLFSRRSAPPTPTPGSASRKGCGSYSLGPRTLTLPARSQADDPQVWLLSKQV